MYLHLNWYQLCCLCFVLSIALSVIVQLSLLNYNCCVSWTCHCFPYCLCAIYVLLKCAFCFRVSLSLFLMLLMVMSSAVESIHQWSETTRIRIPWKCATGCPTCGYGSTTFTIIITMCFPNEYNTASMCFLR